MKPAQPRRQTGRQWRGADEPSVQDETPSALISAMGTNAGATQQRPSGLPLSGGLCAKSSQNKIFLSVFRGVQAVPLSCRRISGSRSAPVPERPPMGLSVLRTHRTAPPEGHRPSESTAAALQMILPTQTSVRFFSAPPSQNVPVPLPHPPASGQEFLRKTVLTEIHSLLKPPASRDRGFSATLRNIPLPERGRGRYRRRVPSR